MKIAFKQGIWKEKNWGEIQQEATRKTAGAGRRRASRNCTLSGNDPSTLGRKQAADTWNSKLKSAERFGHPFHSATIFRISRYEKRSDFCSGRHTGNEARNRDHAFASSNH
jgi:hypothetical protein